MFVLLPRPHHTKPAGRSPDLWESHETLTADIPSSGLFSSTTSTTSSQSSRPLTSLLSGDHLEVSPGSVFPGGGEVMRAVLWWETLAEAESTETPLVRAAVVGSQPASQHTQHLSTVVSGLVRYQSQSGTFY